MSINGGDKEYFYKLHLKFNPKKLGQLLGVDFKNIELEKYLDGKKIDMYGVTECQKEVFGEVQLGFSDMKHYFQLTKTLNNVNISNDIILFWVAEKFTSEIIDKIQHEINRSNKNIEFIAIELNPDIKPYLEVLNNLPILKVMQNLQTLTEIKNHLRVYAKYYRLNNENLGEIEIPEPMIDLNTNEGIMKYMLTEAREQLHYFPSIHRNKRLNGNSFQLGALRADITYSMGLNKNNFLYVELRFNSNTEDIFKQIISDKELIDDKLDFLAEYDTSFLKIGTYIYLRKKNKEQILKQTVRVLDKYVRLFTPYIVGNDGTNLNK